MVSTNHPTIKDVAQLAGVSTATVSRVINRSGSISNDTRNLVVKAVNELGYKPQRTRKKPAGSPWLGIMVEKIEDPFFARVLTGIYHQAKEEKMIPFAIEMGDNHAHQLTTLNQLKCLSLVGVISAGFFQTPDEWISYYDEIDVPIVLTNTKVYHPKITSIMVNFELGTYRATQHLLNLNHTRIAYLGALDYPDFSTAEFRGVKRALDERGIPYPDEYQISVSYSPEGASQGISRLMMLPAEIRPTAIYMFDDEMAIYALNSIRQYGLRIPEDISIIGFDNIPMASYTNPPLTTVDIPKRRIGQQAVLLLKQLMENESDTVGYTYIDGSLVVRESTGPCPLAK